MCHQTVSLVAEVLEAGGIPSVVLGSARDIVEEVGVARFYFTDFPLGNPVGRPDADDEQMENLRNALRMFETAGLARTTVQSPHVWGETGWRERFMQILDPDALAREGAARRARQAAVRDAAGSDAG